MQLTPQQASELLDLARNVIRFVLSKTQLVVSIPKDPALHQPAGAFVSLHALATHRLRGCVGRLDAAQPMYQAVAHAAQSVLGDPRFEGERVRLDELPNLEIEISLLSPLQPAQNTTDFDLLNDGIFLTVGDRSGCFLPQVARETKWSKEQLLDRLATEKLGLPARTWTLPGARLQKFSTLLVGPEPFISEKSQNTETKN
ncbi:MAG TPA: AmmeMemoRadiSam system protein A [Tepidisphaeraceae bacterium]|jgi:AmmeMemoRadiSam system protein A|nr:AmmeMemoRadiSam system protein A [Tepidisphaeraceae bacterium]